MATEYGTHVLGSVGGRRLSDFVRWGSPRRRYSHTKKVRKEKSRRCLRLTGMRLKETGSFSFLLFIYPPEYVFGLSGRENLVSFAYTEPALVYRSPSTPRYQHGDRRRVPGGQFKDQPADYNNRALFFPLHLRVCGAGGGW